jgi:arylsulfatase A-like enzyme
LGRSKRPRAGANESAVRPDQATSAGGWPIWVAGLWPAGLTAKGEYRDQPGHLIDLMATYIDLGRATYPKEFNGHAITPMEGRRA